VRAMKPDATLINTARGGLLREREIYDVLRERTDITAVLDVLESEPVSRNDPLLSLPNVIVSPHIAGSQGLECRRMGEFVIAEYNRWINGESLLGRITQEDLVRRA
jgi:phosphoglycerate dehydrogenase-like enzyme